MGTSGNKEELKNLIEAGQHVAAFVGAGCSKVLSIPVWDDLLIALNNEFKAYESKEELLDAIKKYDYPLVASTIEKKAVDRKKYLEIIQKNTIPKSCYYTSLHIKLIQLFNTFVTTNYDKSLEDAHEVYKDIDTDKKFAYHSHSVPLLSLFGFGTNRNIYHIHGDNANANFILTYESYKEQYDSPGSGVATLMNATFRDFTVVFIGFSFNDTFFVNFMKETMSSIRAEMLRHNKQNSPTHYCILSDNNLKIYYTPQEIISDTGIKIQDLIDLHIIERVPVAIETKEAYKFKEEAIKIISEANLHENSKTQLGLLAGSQKSGEERLELLKQLDIKPITFEENDFLKIEEIISELSQRTEVRASFTN